MAELLRKDTRTEAWKALVTRLPGILGAEFILSDDVIREVHILSDQSRTAKQIVRDVQSAMLARFQVELDHRVVSVAQIPGSVREKRSRLLCEQLSISSGRAGGTVSVRLRLDDQDYLGEAPCEPSISARVRGIALATVAALNCFLAPASLATAGEVRRVQMGDAFALLVEVQLRVGGHTERLLGACFEGEDPNLSVVYAVLDAVNRRFPVLDAPTED